MAEETVTGELALSSTATVSGRKADTAVAPLEVTANAESSGVPASSGGRKRKVPTVVFFGTSLTFGYGLSPDEAFPALIEREAANDGIAIHAINGGLSGETTAGLLRRITAPDNPRGDIVVIESGANDALRGLDVDSVRSNIDGIVRKAKVAQRGARIFLLEMFAPSNLGPAYTTSFQSIYRDVARKQHIKLVPFFLESVAGRPELNQADGIHPNAAGAKIIADNVWRFLKPTARQLSHRR